MSKDFIRYLKLLGIEQKKPSINELNRIVRSHLIKIPFENISKLYYLKTTGLKGIPELALFLDGIESYHFGGTCYSNNIYLYQLLKFLGYNAELCGADMSSPDVHLVSIIKIEGREFIIDAGYAAPLLLPLPRDLATDYKISLGTDEYILCPMDKNKRSRLILNRNGSYCHGYLVNPAPRNINEFKHLIEDSFRKDATFMNCILLVLFKNNYSLAIHNMTLIESIGEKVSKKLLKTTDELIGTITEKFKIPAVVIHTALEDLSMSGDAWS